MWSHSVSIALAGFYIFELFQTIITSETPLLGNIKCNVDGCMSIADHATVVMLQQTLA